MKQVKQDLVDPATGHRAGHFATALMVVLLSTIAWAQAASAQTTPSPGVAPALQPKSKADDPRLKAPVGHRQPRPTDLPSDVQRDENYTVGRDRAIDQKLKICKQC